MGLASRINAKWLKENKKVKRRRPCLSNYRALYLVMLRVLYPFRVNDRYTLGDKLQQHVATTRRSDKSLCVYWRICVKMFVSATEFCRSNMLQKIKSDRIYATCRGDKILLQRQRFSQNLSSTLEAIGHCDVSPQHVSATSRRTCT